MNVKNDGAVIDAFIERVRFDGAGLVPAIVQDVETRDVLMMAWMNRESIRATMTERRTVFFSRSRNELWRKGETSGHVQSLKSISLDCDGDTLLLQVMQTGVACHNGTQTCFSGREFDGDGLE